MGRLYHISCPDCGYDKILDLGVGMFFPIVYKKTMQEAQEGNYGEAYKNFFLAHPDGAINAERVIVKCTCCGDYDSVTDLSLYVPLGNVPEKRKDIPWTLCLPLSSEGCRTGRDLAKYYKKVITFQHCCKNCGGREKIFRTEEKNDDDDPPVFMRAVHRTQTEVKEGLITRSHSDEPFICPNCKKNLNVRPGSWD